MDDKDRKKKVCSCCLKVQDKDNHSKCSNCRIAVYCDAKCQKEHWPIHKFICKDSNDDDDDLKLFKKCNACLVQSDWARGEKLFQKLLKRMQKTNNKEMEFEGIIIISIMIIIIIIIKVYMVWLNVLRKWVKLN